MAATITQGDIVPVAFYAQTKKGQRVTLTGATITSQVKGASASLVDFAADKHSVDPDQVTNKGKFFLNLAAAGADSASIKDGDGHEIVFKIVVGGTTIHYRATINVRKAAPRS